MVDTRMYTTESWTLRRMFHEGHNSMVLIKIPMQDTFNHYGQVMQEISLFQSIKSQWLLSVIACEMMDGKYCILYEDFQAISLLDWLREERELVDLIDVALALANALLSFEQQQLIFNCVNPHYIFIHPISKEIKFLSTAFSLKWEREGSMGDGPMNIPTTDYPYLSPEQTGKINTEIDFTTDLYGLGTILFEMLVKKPPFINRDVMMLQYEILASIPTFHTVYFIPPSLESIVRKLLMKKQIERYQSAIGLKQDLLMIKHQLETGHFEAFAIATKDVNLQHSLVKKVYGQETMMQILQDEWAQLSATAKVILVDGEFGSGRTTLLHAFQEKLASEQHLVALLDVEQLENLTEEDWLVLPLRQFMRQLYVNDEERAKQWQQCLKQHQVAYTSHIDAMLPELKWFTTEQGQLRELKEIINILYSLLDLLKWPITILLDNVDYLKQEQQQHIECLMQANQHRSVLFVFTYESKARMQGFTSLHVSNKIELSGLTVDQVEQWVADSYGSNTVGLRALASYLHRIANGNPYYILAFFKAMASQESIQFDFLQNRWVIEVEKLTEVIEQKSIDIRMWHGWQVLSPNLKEVVKKASCLGIQFDYIWLGENSEQLEQVMQQLIEMNLLTHVANTTYQFLSQANLDAIFHSIPEAEQQALRFSFLQRLVQANEMDAMSWARLFLHLSEQGGIISEIEEGLFTKGYDILQLLMQQQKNRTALHVAQRLLDIANRGQQQEKKYELLLCLAQIQMAKHQLADGLLSLQEGMFFATNRTQKIKIHRLRMAILLRQGHAVEALQQAQQAFKIAGLTLYKSSLATRYMAVRIARQLKKKSDEALRNLPVNENEEVIELIRIAHQLLLNWQQDETVQKIGIYSAVDLSIRYGTHPEIAYSFMYYAMVLAQKKEPVLSKRYATLALDLAKQQGNLVLEARVMSLYGKYLSWDTSYNQTIDYLAKAALSHDSQWMNNQLHMMSNRFVKGVPIKILLGELKRMQHDSHHQSYLKELKSWLELMEGKSFSTIGDVMNYPLDYDIYLLRMNMSFLFNQDEIMEQLYSEARDFQRCSQWQLSPLHHYFHLYKTLWQFRWLASGKYEQFEKRYVMKEIKQAIAELKYWADFAPNRYEHVYVLVLAEWHAFQGHQKEAIQQYHHAATVAKLHDYHLDEAVVYYCAASFYKRLKDKEMAKNYLQQATKVLHDYGAITLINSWESQFGESMTQFQIKSKQPGQVVSIDIDAFLQMTKTVMQDLHVNDFIHNVLDTLAKYAGASNGLFLLKDGEGLKVKAKAVNTATTIFSGLRPFGILEQYQQEVVLYTLQMREPVIVDEQVRAYLMKQTDIPPYAMVCIPIAPKNTVRGAILLENRMLSSVFHHHQLGFFQAISTLISVSLENAELYEKLEEIVNNRTEQLRLANQDLQMKNSQLHAKEMERKQLFHNISHELRSPITSSIGFMDAILEGVVKDQEKQQVYLVRSKERLMTLNRLIQDIFDLANLESGRLTFQFHYISMQQLVEFFHDRYQAEVQSAQLHYEFMTYDLPKAKVLIDLTRIEQVVWNLISNAIKNTNQGTITVAFSADDDTFYCTVKDTGKGVDKQDQPFIFDSYYKAANVPKVSSTGIGLAICQQIILQHRGEITVASAEGRGAAFTITLPLYKK